VLATLGVLAADVAPLPEPIEFSRWTWLRTAAPGWWSPTVTVGAEVKEGQLLGSVESLDDDTHESITAPTAGVPLFLTTSPAVEKDGLLLGLASN
jgi:uncharacterized protein